MLHSITTYLNLSENWIYPQIACVPDADTRVVCSEVANLADFPIASEKLILDRPTWDQLFGIPRLLDAAARRLHWRRMYGCNQIRKWKPEALHAHFGTRGWEALSLRKALHIPLITSFYGYDAWLVPEVDPKWHARYRDLFEQGDIFLVEGSAMAARLAVLDCPRSKILVHRIGVDLDSLPFEPKRFSDELRIVMVGRFVEKKGLVDGLSACCRARSSGVNLTVTIIGDMSAGDRNGERIRQELQVLASRPELCGRVQFTGFLPLRATRELVSRQNIFLCPSKHAANGDAEGGSPVALAEAMALGLVPIGTNHCDIPEIVIDGKTGYLCNEGDVDGMANLLCVIESSPDSLAELAKEARAHIETNFSLLKQLDKVQHIYESIGASF